MFLLQKFSQFLSHKWFTIYLELFTLIATRTTFTESSPSLSHTHRGNNIVPHTQLKKSAQVEFRVRCAAAHALMLIVFPILSTRWLFQMLSHSFTLPWIVVQRAAHQLKRTLHRWVDSRYVTFLLLCWLCYIFFLCQC